jgi:hypothetical protein
LLISLLPVKAGAQPQGRPAKIGVVSLHAKELESHVDGIRHELQKLGYVEGRTITIVSHFTDGDRQRARGTSSSPSSQIRWT